MRAAAIAVSALSLVAPLAAQSPDRFPERRRADAYDYGDRYGYDDRGPGVTLWLAGDNLLQRGDRARLYLQTGEDAFVIIVRIDTDGRLRIVYPSDPYEAGYLRGGTTYRVPGRSEQSFVVDDRAGIGYVFAIASYDGFDFDAVSRGRMWDFRLIGDRVRGDPLTAMYRFAERILDNPRDGYSLDYVPYYVEGYLDYPRFLCYGCHADRVSPGWDSYAGVCRRYRVLAWDHPYNYPYRHHSAERTVYSPHRNRRPLYELERVPPGSRMTPENFVQRQRRDGAIDPWDRWRGGGRSRDDGRDRDEARDGDDVGDRTEDRRRRRGDVAPSAPHPDDAPIRRRPRVQADVWDDAADPPSHPPAREPGRVGGRRTP